MSIKKNAPATWVVGQGHAGLEESLPPTTRTQISKEDAGKAVTNIASVVASATGAAPAVTNTSGGHEVRLLDYVLKAARGNGQVKVLLKEMADRTGVSPIFVRFFVDKKAATALAAHSVSIVSSDATSITVEETTTMAQAVAAPVSEEEPKKKGKVRAVRAAGAQAENAPAQPTASTTNVDVGYFAFNPVVKAKIKACIRKCHNFWLVGETGCGKSEYYERILEELAREISGLLFLKVSFNGESSVDDLLGHYTLRGGETIWIEGALPKAMKLGLPLICEEVDAAPAEANLAMQRALEVRSGKARRFYNARNGEEVAATVGFCILATANTAGGGDHSGLYPGTQVQNSAFRDRFGFERVTYPEADVETEIIIRRTGLDKFLAEKAVEFAGHARVSLKQGELLTPVSTRTLLAFATLYQDFAEEGMPQKVAGREAMLSAVIYKSANPADEAALRELVQRIFGTR